MSRKKSEKGLIGFFLIVAMAFQPSALTSQTREIDATRVRSDLRGGPNSCLAVFVDPGGEVGLDDVIHHPQWFAYPDVEVPDIEDASSVVWVRLAIKNGSKQSLERYLEIQWPHFDRINLYALSSGGSMKYSYEAGEDFIFSERPVQSRFFVFPLYLEPEQEQVIFLRARASGGLHLPLVLWSAMALADKERIDNAIQGVYAGSILVMVLYNIFLLFSVRDRTYLYYVLYVCAYFLTQSGFTGLGFQYLWPWSPWIQLRYFPIFDGLTVSSFLLFSRTFLQSKENAPVADRFLRAIMWSGAGLILLPFFFSPGTANKICNLYVPVLVLTVLGIAIRIWIGGFRPARFFTLAFLFLAVFVVLNQLRSLGLIPVSFVTENGTQIGSLMEVVLLSFALGDRISTLKLERERMQLLAEERQRKLSMIGEELDVARQIQGAIVQKEFPSISGLSIAVRFQPMSQVGGDFYDFHQTGESSACVVVADVAGHGVPAALLASMAQMSFDLQEGEAESPGSVLDGMNQMLIGRMGNFFLSAECAHLNARDMELRFASAGHPAALLIRKGLKRPIQLRPRGRLIGPFAVLALEELCIPLEEGDRLLMFSDAILEARNANGVFFGMHRLISFARRHDALGAEPFASVLLDTVLDWVNPEQLDDDFTLLVIDIKR